MKDYLAAARVWVGRATEADAEGAIRRALREIGAPASDTARSVAIKINICEYRLSNSGAITDPAMLGALLSEARRLWPSAELSIFENDATSLDIDTAYRLLGFTQVAREHGAVLRNVAHERWIRKPVSGGLIFQELEVPEIIETTDVFINFAKLKTNALTKTTGCLKNIFALLREKRKVTLHGRIDQVLQDMNKVIRPHICLIDGIVGMEGIGGPAFGRPRRCNLLIAGRNPVAVDACGARIMGFRPASIRHISMCHKAGLGPIRYSMATDIDNFRYDDYKFRFQMAEYVLRNALRSRAGFAT
jgi:uncharacterized protein (DUF362 family)